MVVLSGQLGHWSFSYWWSVEMQCVERKNRVWWSVPPPKWPILCRVGR